MLENKIYGNQILMKIKACFKGYRILYTRHARKEMINEPYGRIREEVFEAVLNGEIIEDYHNDKPYSSVLIFGKTKNDRPLHVVCSYCEEENLAIVITVYHPDPNLWINFRRRKVK